MKIVFQVLPKSENWIHLLLLEGTVLVRVKKQLSRALQAERKHTGDT